MALEFRLFTRECITKAKNVVENLAESAVLHGGGGFAEWAMFTLQALKIELGRSYRHTINLLDEMPDILEEIGLTKFPHFTVLRNWFEKILTETYRSFLGESAEKRTGHAAIDSIGFDRDQPSRHYAQRAPYRVRSLKITALVDVKTLYVFDVHCTTTKKHDAKIGPQVARRNAEDLRSLAADRAYDGKPFRDDLRVDRIRPLIKHRIYSSLDRAHNARLSRRWMVETVFSSIKRTFSSAVRARS